MGSWQNNVSLLEKDDPFGETEVGVRPFVNLVGEGHVDAEQEDVPVEGGPAVNLFWGRGTLLVEDVCQKWNADHKVVAVHLKLFIEHAVFTSLSIFC